MRSYFREREKEKEREGYIRYWKSQSWLFHVCLEVGKCIMEPMLLYFLALLPWTQKALYSILQPCQLLLRRLRDKMGIPWVVYNYIATIYHLGETRKLNLSTHMMSHRIFSWQDMCVQLWIFIVQYLIEKDGVTRGRMVMKASQWQLLNNGSIPLKIPYSLCA